MRLFEGATARERFDAAQSAFDADTRHYVDKKRELEGKQDIQWSDEVNAELTKLEVWWHGQGEAEGKKKWHARQCEKADKERIKEARASVYDETKEHFAASLPKLKPLGARKFLGALHGCLQEIERSTSELRQASAVGTDGAFGEIASEGAEPLKKDKDPHVRQAAKLVCAEPSSRKFRAALALRDAQTRLIDCELSHPDVAALRTLLEHAEREIARKESAKRLEALGQ